MIDDRPLPSDTPFLVDLKDRVAELRKLYIRTESARTQHLKDAEYLLNSLDSTSDLIEHYEALIEQENQKHYRITFTNAKAPDRTN